LTRIGIDPTKGITFIDNANEDRTIGPVGWTVVRPIKANTTIYNAAPIDTIIRTSAE
jgi:hypothetical protein